MEVLLKKAFILCSLIGLFTGCQSMKKSDGAKAELAAPAPTLTKPEVKKVWVPPAIEEDGKVYREGYFKWVLQKGTVFHE